MIFSRQRGSAGRHVRSRHNRGEANGSAQQGPGWNDETRVVEQVGGAVVGPYDEADAPDDGVQRLDLGALRIPALPEIELRVEAGAQGHIQQVVLVWGASALQVGAYAAPRTEGIWDEVREDIRSTRIAEGGQAVEIDGEYDVELRVRALSPQGPMDLRYVGVEGPRWLLLGIYQGAAAADPAAAGLLREAFGRLVVVRGTVAMPVREALPLRLPPDLAAQAAGAAPPGNPHGH